MYKNHSSGFTLIELLVVIGIIGILSAVVLASLNTARSKGSDAAIQSDLDTVKTQAEIYHNDNNSYGTAASDCSSGMFSADGNIAGAISGADNANGPSGIVECNSISAAYAVSAQMSASTTQYWCVDSTGTSKQESSVLGAATACQ